MKGKNAIDLNWGHHRIKYACPTPVLISLDEQPAYAVSGTGTIRLRNFEGKLSVDPTEAKQEYDLDITSTHSQRGEAVDPETPIPAPTPPSNYLAKLRQRVRDSMVTTREAFAEQRSIYEVIDNLDEFEEEREARRNDASQEPDQPDTTSDTGELTSDATGEVSEPKD